MVSSLVLRFPSAIFWSHNLLSNCDSCDYTYANASTIQCFLQYQTPIWHSAPKESQIWWQSIEAKLSAHWIILEIKLQLNFSGLWLLKAQQQQEVNFKQPWWSLQSYTADFRPCMHTTVLLVVHVNADFFKDAKERLQFLVGLLSSKRGLKHKAKHGSITQIRLFLLHHKTNKQLFPGYISMFSFMF